MATTKTTSKRSKSRNGSRATSSSAGKGSASKRSARSSSANSRSKTRSTSRSQKKGNVEAIKDTVDTAVEQTKSAGATIADAAGKAKTPLIAGGTALLGLVAGAAINGRLSGKSKNPIKRMRGASLPKLDMDKVKVAADRVSAYGQQASDIAAAVEKTRKKNG